MANARIEFIRTSDTLLTHFADFFFFSEYFILRGIFFQSRGKNILFGEGNGAEFRPQKQQKKNTEGGGSKGQNATFSEHSYVAYGSN